jgi:hypothetical protein
VVVNLKELGFIKKVGWLRIEKKVKILGTTKDKRTILENPMMKA